MREQNSKHKILNTNKGITLIALVITIIVMLILVAVIISMAVNGGLFDYAGKAVGETQNAINDEQALSSGKVQVDGKIYNSIDEYISSSNKEQITFYIEHSWGTDEYTVDKGTTWEDFILEVDPADFPGEEDELRHSLFMVDGKINVSPDGKFGYEPEGLPNGAIGAIAGAPVFETTGSVDAGPYVFPSDVIKAGVTYNAIR